MITTYRIISSLYGYIHSICCINDDTEKIAEGHADLHSKMLHVPTPRALNYQSFEFSVLAVAQSFGD